MASRIVVVDDNQDAADSFAVLLQIEGHDVHVAYDGESALKIIAQYRPNVALIDLGMPGIDGYELARRIRRNDREYMLLIAVTAWGRPEDKDRAIKAGFDYHMLKPVDIDALQALLASCDPESSR